MSAGHEWENTPGFALHRTLSGGGDEQIKETSVSAQSSTIQVREGWACSRGLMPRGQSQVPSALEGQVDVFPPHLCAVSLADRVSVPGILRDLSIQRHNRGASSPAYCT